MWVHATNALAGLERDVLGMGDLVEMQLDSALAALMRRDAVLADEVLRGDDQVDLCDVKIEAAGLEALSTHRLAREELRLVVAAVRINTQLERVGDLAVNLAERAITLTERPPLDAGDEVSRMGARVQGWCARASPPSRRETPRSRAASSTWTSSWTSSTRSRSTASSRSCAPTRRRSNAPCSCSPARGTRARRRPCEEHRQGNILYLVEGKVVRHARARNRLGETLLIRLRPARRRASPCDTARGSPRASRRRSA